MAYKNPETINPKKDWVFKLMFSKGDEGNKALPVMSDDSIIQFIYVALNELIDYTIKKDISDYTAKDFWIRFLSNYEQDKQSGMLEKLCALEEGLKMAETTLCRVTEEERRIAWELSEQNYREILAAEREEGEALGFEKGAYRNKLETVKNMTAMHFPIAAISGATGLSEAEIKNLQSESKALF